jgi:hypothetical protein
MQRTSLLRSFLQQKEVPTPVRNETIQTDFYSRSVASCRADSGVNSHPVPVGRDQREASLQMLAVGSTAVASQPAVAAQSLRGTCRHFRYRLPRVDADELRRADPAPCPVCDAEPTRQFKMVQWFA